jgi:hypothetical protein
MARRADRLPGMADTPSAEHESVPVTFVGFVLSLAHTAAVRFGDIPDPQTGRPSPPDVNAARQIIAILAILEEKTRGNLSAEERQFLHQILLELRERLSQTQEPQPRIIAP